MPRFTQLILVFAMASCGAVVALESDRQQPIHIQADNAMLDEKAGTSVYRGEVTIDQGTLHIAADKVEIITDGERIIQIIASGGSDPDSLAHYEQQPREDEDIVYADARKITYFVQEERLHLTGRAHLRQSSDTFSGELVYYNVNEGVVDASSGKEGDRVLMTINPKNE